MLTVINGVEWLYLKGIFEGWLVFKYFVMWPTIDHSSIDHCSPENFPPKNVKKSENGYKPAKNTLGIALLQ
jgi:hypothetical protein